MYFPTRLDLWRGPAFLYGLRKNRFGLLVQRYQTLNTSLFLQPSVNVVDNVNWMSNSWRREKISTTTTTTTMTFSSFSSSSSGPFCAELHNGALLQNNDWGQNHGFYYHSQRSFAIRREAKNKSPNESPAQTKKSASHSQSSSQQQYQQQAQVKPQSQPQLQSQPQSQPQAQAQQPQVQTVEQSSTIPIQEKVVHKATDNIQNPEPKPNLEPKSKEKDTIPINPLSADPNRHRKQNRDDSEIDPLSFGGVVVVILGAVIFYVVYKVDQSNWNGLNTGNFGLKRKVPTLEEYLTIKQSREGLHIIPDDWGITKIVYDHYKNVVMQLVSLIRTGKTSNKYYNSEWLQSKLWRLIHTPNAHLLPPVKQQFVGRTLVIDLNTVCHSTWSRNEGIKRTMRPYYKEMIMRAAMAGWEVVLFGTDEDMDWMESPDFPKLDEMGGLVSHYLWRKDCYYFNSHYCKDLSRLNRPLHRVLVIDSDPRNVQMYPENAIMINKWDPTNPEDEELRKLFILLEFLQKGDVPDIRIVLETHRGKDIGNEFQQRYQQAIQGR